MKEDKNQTITDAMFVLNGSLNKIAVVLEEVLRLVKEDVTCWRSSSLKKRNRKYQAASFKQHLTMVQG